MFIAQCLLPSSSAVIRQPAARPARRAAEAWLGTYPGWVPDRVSPLASSDEAELDAVHLVWAGPTEPGARHHTGSRGRDCSSRGTGPSPAPTAPSRSVATLL